MDEEGKLYQRRFERERAARTAAEKLLEEKSDALYESLIRVQSSEALLKSAMDSMADGLLLVNSSGDVILANEQLKQIYPGQAMYFQKGSNLTYRFPQLMRHPEYLLATRAQFDGVTFEVFLDDQRTIMVSLSKTSEGLISSTHRDITTIKASEEERRQLLVDLLKAQRMEAIGRMSSMIAHDFNNIIASIKGYAGFLEEDIQEHRLRGYASKILVASQKASDLIKDIHQSQEEKSLPALPVSLIPLLEDCLDLFSATLSEKIELYFEPDETPIWIDGSERRLHQLFTNLLTNSRRAIGSFSGAIRLDIEESGPIDLANLPRAIEGLEVEAECEISTGITAQNHPCAVITLTDTGEGILPETMTKIFNMFFTTRSSQPSSGLGMSSVLDILEDTQGGIRLLSTPGVGTQVQIVLPLSRQHPSKPARANQSVQNGIARSDVLIVDDDQVVGEMIRQMVERLGYSVEHLDSGGKALNILEENPGAWRLIISDQIMPGLKGSELYEKLQDREINIPFLICSGEIDAEGKELPPNIASTIIPKPVDKDVLSREISKHIGQ